MNYLDGRFSLRAQLGDKAFFELFMPDPPSYGGAFFDATKYRITYTSDPKKLEEAGVEIPKKASECNGFIRRTYKPMI